MVYIDNWGIPLRASAMTVDASGVAQRSSIGEWHWMHVYWAMWSLFSSTIEQCEVHLTKVKFVQVCNHWTVLLDALYRDEHGCRWGGVHDRWCWRRGSPTPVVQSLDSSSRDIVQRWTRMWMRWSTWPLMLVTWITNTSGAMETTRETGSVWEIFTGQWLSNASS